MGVSHHSDPDQTSRKRRPCLSEGETWLATGSRTVCDERPRNGGGEFSSCKTSRIAPQGYISGNEKAEATTSAEHL